MSRNRTQNLQAVLAGHGCTRSAMWIKTTVFPSTWAFAAVNAYAAALLTGAPHGTGARSAPLPRARWSKPSPSKNNGANKPLSGRAEPIYLGATSGGAAPHDDRALFWAHCPRGDAELRGRHSQSAEAFRGLWALKPAASRFSEQVAELMQRYGIVRNRQIVVVKTPSIFRGAAGSNSFDRSLGYVDGSPSSRMPTCPPHPALRPHQPRPGKALLVRFHRPLPSAGLVDDHLSCGAPAAVRRITRNRGELATFSPV